ncbi:MAG: S8 family serine peptidase [Candidatus Sericytochromatia bacterium]|nr:S8 family serine peptidase [Candidatus Sericytochromatia bacterium]
MGRKGWKGLAVGLGAVLFACQAPVSGTTPMADESVASLAKLKTAPAAKRHVAIGFSTLPSGAALRQLLAGLPVVITRLLPNAQVVVVTLDQPGDETVLAKLAKLPNVDYADWDGVGSILAGMPTTSAAGLVTGDPRAPEQWALSKIQAPAAWTLTQGSPETVIAIVDTGIDLDHPDLRAKLVGGTNIPAPQQTPKDDFGHGTHVAGIAAAVVGNGVGVAGVAPAARLMPVKVNVPGSGGLEESAVADGILWAAGHGADVINLSLGFSDGDSEFRTLGRAVHYALSRKCIVIAAMGNGFQTFGANHAQYPAAWSRKSSLSQIITVGATMPKDTRWPGADTGNWITLSAPGYSILSTAPTYTVPMTGMRDAALGADMRLNYGQLTGTSMAAPYVSGLAALLLHRESTHEPAVIKRKLEMSADRVGGADLGVGRINALATLKLR